MIPGVPAPRLIVPQGIELEHVCQGGSPLFRADQPMVVLAPELLAVLVPREIVVPDGLDVTAVLGGREEGRGVFSPRITRAEARAFEVDQARRVLLDGLAPVEPAAGVATPNDMALLTSLGRNTTVPLPLMSPVTLSVFASITNSPVGEVITTSPMITSLAPLIVSFPLLMVSLSSKRTVPVALIVRSPSTLTVWLKVTFTALFTVRLSSGVVAPILDRKSTRLNSSHT